MCAVEVSREVAVVVVRRGRRESPRARTTGRDRQGVAVDPGPRDHGRAVLHRGVGRGLDRDHGLVLGRAVDAVARWPVVVRVEVAVDRGEVARVGAGVGLWLAERLEGAAVDRRQVGDHAGVAQDRGEVAVDQEGVVVDQRQAGVLAGVDRRIVQDRGEVVRGRGVIKGGTCLFISVTINYYDCKVTRI